MLEETSDYVLIVGAGPTGMVLAIELKRRGVNCRIVEKRAKHNKTSRSFTIHARTMELFDMAGLSDAVLKGSILNKGFIFNFKGNDVKPTLNCEDLNTPHPYIAISSQYDLEEILSSHLSEKLGQTIEWNTEVVELKATNSGGSSATLKNTLNNTLQVVEPAFIVGCDGSRSFVRSACGLQFPGSNYDGMVMQLMDVQCSGFKGSDDRIHYYMSRDSFFLISRLPGDKYRIVVSKMGEGDPSLSKRELFQKLLDGHFEGTVVGEPEWVTKWEIWKRLADRYRVRNIFLAGDSAHTHSPSGGQGMNVGVQDACNLGWKLALEMKKLGNKSLLESYEAERKPIGSQVIEGTDALHNILMAHGKGMQDRLEIVEKEGWHDETIQRISGLSYHYIGAIKLPKCLKWGGRLQPGNRAPDAELQGHGRLFELMKEKELMMLIACGVESVPEDVKDIESEVKAKFSDIMKIVFLDEREGEFAEKYGHCDNGFICVIRQDGYILLRCKIDDGKEATRFLETIFNAA